MEFKFFGPNKEEKELAPEIDDIGLPTTREMIEDSGAKPHFFVDTSEGVAVAFDAEKVKERCDSALKSLEDGTMPNFRPEWEDR